MNKSCFPDNKNVCVALNLNAEDSHNNAVRMDECFYVLSLATAIFVTSTYYLVFRTVYRHVSISGVRITILKCMCVFDLLHIYLQSIAIYLCNNYRYSLLFDIVRYALHSSFITAVMLNPLLSLDQYLHLRFGLHYYNILASTNVGVVICVYVSVVMSIQTAAFFFKLETYMFAISLTGASMLMLVLISYILRYANDWKTPHRNISQQVRTRRQKWKRYLTKVILFVFLTISISCAVFLIKHGGQRINYLCIKIATVLACMYLICTPLLHVWMMADIKKFFVRDCWGGRNNKEAFFSQSVTQVEQRDKSNDVEQKSSMVQYVTSL